MKNYLLVGTGDGHFAKVVAEDKLEEEFLACIWGTADNCPADEKEPWLAALRNSMMWTTTSEQGQVRFMDEFEDGRIEVILITEEINHAQV